MPFFEIPPENLEHLPLFGYDKISEDDNFAWYSGPKGRMRVDKKQPFVWLEDMGEAGQLGAVAVVPSPPPT